MRDYDTADQPTSRRRFMWAAGAGIGATLLIPAGLAGAEKKPEGKEEAKGKKGEEGEKEVGPVEDLMREHGLLSRVFLVYEEALRRMDAEKADLQPEAIMTAARIIREFVEDYHEKNEENHIFPRLRKAGKEIDLVEVLKKQHDAGRRVTEEIKAAAKSLGDEKDRKRLADLIHEFTRMYRPHKAREDTILFPAFKKVVNDKEYRELGDQFEEQEHKLFGEDGFEKMLGEVASMEKKLGIFDLAQFTPKSSDH